MNPYMEKLMATQFYIEETPQGETVADALYGCYREIHPLDHSAIQEGFRQLDGVLNALPLRAYDQVWNLTCGLCCDHEKSAFLEGVRVGIALAMGAWED